MEYLTTRELSIVELLLQGCENEEIHIKLGIGKRTVKAHLNRMFVKFGICGGIKRVKLAVMLYRRLKCSEGFQELLTAPRSRRQELQLIEKKRLLGLSQKAFEIRKLLPLSAQPSTSLKTISESSLTNSECGIDWNSLYGMSNTTDEKTSLYGFEREK